MSKFTITADSEPQYGRFFTSSWSCADWKKWHQENVAKYGKLKANEKMIAAWNNPDAPSFGANRGDCLSFNNDFTGYAKKEGFYTAISNGLGGVINETVAVAKNVGSGAVSLTEGIVNTAKLTKWILPIVLLAALWLAFKFSKQKLNIA